MKKIFCDCCGEEMSYDNPDIKVLTDRNTSIALPLFDGSTTDASLKFDFGFNNKPGKHYDICQECRWSIIFNLVPKKIYKLGSFAGNFKKDEKGMWVEAIEEGSISAFSSIALYQRLK